MCIHSHFSVLSVPLPFTTSISHAFLVMPRFFSMPSLHARSRRPTSPGWMHPHISSLSLTTFISSCACLPCISCLPFTHLMKSLPPSPGVILGLVRPANGGPAEAPRDRAKNLVGARRSGRAQASALAILPFRRHTLLALDATHPSAQPSQPLLASL